MVTNAPLNSDTLGVMEKTLNHLSKRNNPLKHCPNEDVELALSIIIQYFNEKWLKNKTGTHPLQILWNRRDALATIELFTFGSSLIAAEKASKSWTENQVKLITSKDENNQRGAIFEILFLGYTASRQVVTPARANQPGYDVDILTDEGFIYRASLKCHSKSSHEKIFCKKAEIAEKKALDGLKTARHNALVYIEAKEYPIESDWQKLYSAIYKITSLFQGEKIINEVDDKWLIGCLPLKPELNERFSYSHLSYSFVCTSPYHKNEQPNFLSKLESAVSNMERHVVSDVQYSPIIIMQLPATASAETLTYWATEYLNANSKSPVEAVLFLQPYTASNEDMSSSHIAHFTSIAISNSFITKTIKGLNGLKFEIPVGIIATQPPKWELHNDIGEKITLQQYIYQKGKHYILASKNDSGELSAYITKKAPGIESIAVCKINDQDLILRGRWGENLCLIGG